MAKKQKQNKSDTPLRQGFGGQDEAPVVNVLDLGSDFSEPIDVAPTPEGPTIVEGLRFDDSELKAETTTDGKKPRKPRKPKEPESDIPIIDGEMLLLLIDILIPMLISTTHNVVSDTRVSPDDLTLTEKQRTMMRTFADKVAERIRLNANPFLMLFAGLGGIYTMNYLKERDKLKKP